MKKLIITLSAMLLFICLSSSAEVTSFVENFNGPLPPYWQSTASYSLSVKDGKLNMKVTKTSPWATFVVSLPETLNLSANPFVSIRTRVELPVRILLYLVDVNNKSFPIHAKALYSENYYSNILFDFSGASGSIDLTQITKLYMGVNGDALTWTGKVWIDELKMGDVATKKATVGAVKNQTYYHGSKANELLITDVNNSNSILFENAESLVENVSIASVGSGIYKLTFDAKANVSGTVNAKVISEATAGYVNDTVLFDLTVEQNLPPTAVFNTSIETKTGVPLHFSITDITNGNINAIQKINFTLTKISGSSVNLISAVYDTIEARINVSADPISTGPTVYKLVLKDDGGGNDSLVSNITINAYTKYNIAPEFSVPSSLEILLSQGNTEIPILDLSDGNNVVLQESLTFEVVSNNTTVVNNVVIKYIDGNPMKPAILFTPVAAGKAKLQITVSDSGEGYDNGPKQTVKTIDIIVKEDPITGYTIDLANFDAEVAAKKWTIEFEGTGQTVTADNFGGQPCIKIVGTNKGQWNGLWYRTPELDLSKNPYISYEVYSVDNPIQTHVYFWDNKGERNTPGAESERKTVPANVWTTVFMDFRGPSKLVNSSGIPINIQAIDTLLFNYNPQFTYPFTNWTGTIYIRNIKIGSDVPNVPALVPTVTVQSPGNSVFFKETGAQKVSLTGISCGTNCESVPTATIKSNSNPSLLSNVNLSAIHNDTIDLNFTVGTAIGNTTLTVEVAAEGSITTSVSFTIYVVNNASSSTTFSIDTTTKKQVIAGFGADQPSINFIQQFKSTGATVVRFFADGDAIEPLNDNSSATTLDRSKFLNDGLKIDYIKELKMNGINDIIITVLSPPAWMKQNLSTSYATSAAQTWANTNNKVDPIYFDEYIEFMVAIVQLIKERTGVEIMAIAPQNEPAFSQPYGSAILDPVNYAKICGMLGKRLTAMGYKTKVINPEQVFSQNFYPVTEYISAVRADADANKYTSVIGMHYPDNTVSTFRSQYAAASASPYPKEYWGVEMKAEGNDWSKVLTQMQTMVTALNNGVGLWAIYGWNGPPLLTNSINAVGSEIAMMYGSFPTRHFYAIKNIYNHFRPGSCIVGSTMTPVNNNINMVTNLNEKDSIISVVWVNAGASNVVAELTMTYARAKFYRTSEYEFYKEVNPVSGNKILLPAKSVTTLSYSYATSSTPNAISNVISDNNDMYSLYPNPATNQINVVSKNACKFSLSIVDMMGRIILVKNGLDSKTPISISDLNQGIYNVIIKSDKVYVKKLVVQ
jgi:hypothetical protein